MLIVKKIVIFLTPDGAFKKKEILVDSQKLLRLNPLGTFFQRRRTGSPQSYAEDGQRRYFVILPF
jgi:hypothetical protein